MNTLNKYYILFTKIIALAASIAIYRLVTTITSFIGITFLARQSYEGLKASGLINAVQLLFMLFAISILSSSGVMISQTIGARKDKEVNDILFQSFTLATIQGLILIIPMLFIRSILLWLDQPEELVNLTATYFQIYVYAVLPIMWLSCLAQFAMGIMAKKLVIGINLLNLLLFTVFGYIFIFGKFGIPISGIRGLAIANVIQAWLSLLFVGMYILRSSYKEKYNLRLFVRNKKSYFAHLIKIGYPIGLITLNDLFSMFVLMLMVGWLGNDFLAIQQISNQYILLATIPVFGLAQACSLVVSQASSLKAYEEIMNYGIVSLIIGMLVILFFILIVSIFSKPLILLFVAKNQPSTSLINITSTLLLLVLLGQLLSVGKVIITGAYRGLYITFKPLLINFLGSIISVISAYWFGIYLNYGLLAINIGFIAGNFIASIILLYNWIQLDYKQLVRLQQSLNDKLTD